MSAVRTLSEWLPNTFRTSRNSNYAAGIPRMYFECTWNVTGMFKTYREYGPTGYKMLPNLAFSSVSTQSYMDLLDDVALLHMAVL